MDKEKEIEELKTLLWKFDGSWQEYDGEALCDAVDKVLKEHIND